VGKQQLIEIAKALCKDVKLLILDEPTASLNESDSAALLDLLLELKRQGIASILISHKLNEISRVADAITVLRDGNTVGSFDCRVEPVSEDRIIEKWSGARWPTAIRRARPPSAKPSSRCATGACSTRACRAPVIKGINLHARKGEIIGIAGLMGSGARNWR
jgi:putative multiple sugar transport system ATP-binding protein